MQDLFFILELGWEEEPVTVWGYPVVLWRFKRSCFEMFLIQQNAIQAEARHIRITSGIGLSLSRQIMLAHNGCLDLVRSDSQCTRFTLLFR